MEEQVVISKTEKPNSKRCSKCKVVKLFDEFYKDKYEKSGLNCWCKECTKKSYYENHEERLKKGREWKRKNPNKIKANYILNRAKSWERQIKKRFGVTIEEYNNLLKKQRNKCAICEKKTKYRLCVDHNHKTRKVRGLLCYNCNIAIGMLKDDIKLLKRVIKYLEEDNG